MPSVARTAFLRAAAAFTAVADTPAVRAPDDAGDLLRRGLTVSGFNLLEAFIAARLGEIATYLNGGSVQFVDLPEALQSRAIRNTLEIATSRARRMGRTMTELRPLARDVGGSLAAVDRALQLSTFTWLWQGSNMAVNDYAAILRSFHVDKPWQEGNTLAARLGFQSPDLESSLTDLTRERHKCAHEALYGVTAIWLRSVPVRLVALAISFDALVSVAATRLRAGEAGFFADDKAMTASGVVFRYLRERPTGAADMPEGARRAYRVSGDANALYAAAASRCRIHDVLVRQAVAGNVVDWLVPAVS